MLGTKWLKRNTTSWDLTFGVLNIQGYKFKLNEGEDLPNYCRKIVITEDVIVPPTLTLERAGGQAGRQAGKQAGRLAVWKQAGFSHLFSPI